MLVAYGDFDLWWVAVSELLLPVATEDKNSARDNDLGDCVYSKHDHYEFNWTKTRV